MTEQTNHLRVVADDNFPVARLSFGRAPARGSAGLLVARALERGGLVDFGFANWRTTLYSGVLCAVCRCSWHVCTHPKTGHC